MTDPAPPIIELSGVRKLYRRKQVLQVDDLRIAPHEPLLLWGANASGKSTLLRLLAGVTVPTQGHCRIDPAFRHARRALLPQTGGLYEDLTVRQNLLILAQLHDQTPDRAPFSALLDDQADGYLDAPLGTLSGGMQRIVSIAALLSVRPDLLFLDEPFGGLDGAHRARLLDTLHEFGDAIPLLVVTEHDTATLGGRWRKIGLTDGRIGDET